jgi:WD40 repeat protein
VVTASEDHTARVWEPFRGKSIGAPLQHKRAVENAVWSPDGKTVLTGNDDDLALLWPAPTSLNGTPQQIALWLAVRTGLELDESGAFHVLDAAAWQTRRQTLAQLGRPPLP